MEEEFFEEYDELSLFVEKSDYMQFKRNLQRWYDHVKESGVGNISSTIERLLEKAMNISDTQNIFIEEEGGLMGSNYIDWPRDRDLRLGAQLQFVETLLKPNSDPTDFALNFFYSGTKYNDCVKKMSDQFFTPFQKELRRELKKTFSTFIGNIPASDRIVSVDHNAPEYKKITEGVSTLEQQIDISNYIQDVDKDRLQSELKASKEVLSSKTIRLSVIKTLLIGSLSYIIVKFGDAALGQLAEKVLKLICNFFNIQLF